MPGWLQPLLAFVNSIDVELGTDDLAGGPARLSDWLVAQQLVPDGIAVTAREYRLALGLRSGLRDLCLHNNDHTPVAEDTLGDLTRTLRRLPMVADPSGVLGPATERPVVAALTRLAAAYVRAEAAGQWHRLRRCPAGDCAWIFWDSTAQATRKWCTMTVCGNRAKARTFASRRLPR
jgi:predicted RNA-binding Zn ribbon-like protein